MVITLHFISSIIQQTINIYQLRSNMLIYVQESLEKNRFSHQGKRDGNNVSFSEKSLCLILVLDVIYCS